MNKASIRSLIRRTTGGQILGPDPTSPRYPPWLRRLTADQLYEVRVRDMSDDELLAALRSAQAEERDDQANVDRFRVGEAVTIARLGHRMGVVVACVDDMRLATVAFGGDTRITLDYLDLARLVPEGEARVSATEIVG